jgi:undecaprenyl diphosphate synthase
MLLEGYEIDLDKIPEHIAIIMDGNGRWAKQRNLNRLIGHRKGVENLIKIAKFSKSVNVKILSVFAFSTENWKRPDEEVNGLMKLFQDFYLNKFSSLKKEKIKIIHTGSLEKLPKNIIKSINIMEQDTKEFDYPILNIVLNYGGKQEIIDAVKKTIHKINNNDINIDDLDEHIFNDMMYHPEIKDPDLLIRTSGELRLSNFLLWQLAYTELWFTDVLWPDFSNKDLINAIYDYQTRERRFGKVKNR